jgi:hypothetical protein
VRHPSPALPADVSGEESTKAAVRRAVLETARPQSAVRPTPQRRRLPTPWWLKRRRRQPETGYRPTGCDSGGTDAISAAVTAGGLADLFSIYNCPATNITAANAIANIALTNSGASFIFQMGLPRAQTGDGPQLGGSRGNAEGRLESIATHVTMLRPINRKSGNRSAGHRVMPPRRSVLPWRRVVRISPITCARCRRGVGWPADRSRH